MIRPQQQRHKKHQEMIKNLRVNDRVVTIGGIYGTIVKIKDTSCILRVSDSVRIEMLKNAISEVNSEDDVEDGDEE
jgi:preprotein translocase subunit YajC